MARSKTSSNSSRESTRGTSGLPGKFDGSLSKSNLDNLWAVGDRVIVAKAEAAAVTTGGLALPEQLKATNVGKILLVGPKCEQLMQGQIIIFDKAASREVRVQEVKDTRLWSVIEMGVHLAMTEQAARDLGLPIPELTLEELIYEQSSEPRGD